MSWMSGPRKMEFGYIDEWAEEVVWALSQGGRHGAEGDAAWYFYVKKKFPNCWLVYLGPLTILGGAYVLSLVGGGFIGVGVANASHPTWAFVFFGVIVLLFVLFGCLIMLAGFVAGFWRMNWAGKCISIWYVYSVASFAMHGFQELPFSVWTACLTASIATEAIAIRWRERHQPTD